MYYPRSYEMLNNGNQTTVRWPWKPEKWGAFWRWPIIRCFIKSDRAGLIIDLSINFRLNGKHRRAVQFLCYFCKVMLYLKLLVYKILFYCLCFNILQRLFRSAEARRFWWWEKHAFMLVVCFVGGILVTSWLLHFCCSVRYDVLFWIILGVHL